MFDEAVTALIASADIAVANLESPISERGEPQARSYTFRAPPAAAAVLAAAGFDLVGLANNHALDYGQDGLADTEALLREAGVESAGSGRNAEAALSAVVLEREGVHVAFVSLVDAPREGAFSRAGWEALGDRPGLAWADVDTVRRTVTAARQKADVVVALLHFGVEFRDSPTDAQRTLARTAIDSGASLVVGSHPHVVQELEQYGGGLIAYSLGNFVFDGFEGIVDESAALRVTFAGAKIASWELVPARVDDGGRPRLSVE